MTVKDSPVTPPPPRPASLPRRVLAAYAAPAFSQSFVVGPAISVLQGIYGKHFGLSLEQIALVVFVSRLFGAVTDPLIGFLSDAYRARRGSRKPWLIGGALLSVVACWFLYVPFGKVTVLSFLGWFLLADIGWSMSEVPYRAWMAELTQDYGERTRLASWSSVARFVGLAAFFAMPLALAPLLGGSEFTPVTLKWAAAFAALALPTTAVLAALFVPDGAAPDVPPKNPLRLAAGAVAGNRPLWWFVAMYAIGGLGGGLGWGLVFFYIDGYLKLGPQFATLLILSLPIAIFATPVWGSLCRRYGKQQVWALANVAAAAVLLCYMLIEPGPNAALWLGAVLIVNNALVVCEPVAGPAVLADVVDYGRWRFGADHGGTYFAFFAMFTKINVGVGAAIGLAIAGLFGFDAKAPTQTPDGLFGLLFAYSVLPALCYLCAAVLIWRFPIDRRRQRSIVRAIERRERRAGAAAAARAAAALPGAP